VEAAAVVVQVAALVLGVQVQNGLLQVQEAAVVVH